MSVPFLNPVAFKLQWWLSIVGIRTTPSFNPPLTQPVEDVFKKVALRKSPQTSTRPRTLQEEIEVSTPTQRATPTVQFRQPSLVFQLFCHRLS